jgi:predicted methyltransferase
MRRTPASLLLLALASLQACHSRPRALDNLEANWMETTRALVSAPDRTEADRRLDPGRHPAELLAFFGVRPGMRVAELGAGGGYTTELLARAVGPTGRVYGHNAPVMLQRFAQSPWSERLARPTMGGVVRLDRPFDDPFPPDVRDLDQVWMILLYHDTVWMGVDRDRMNRAVAAALRPGGVYAIVDHSARPGTGTADVETLHRIDEQVVLDEVKRAGFDLVAESNILRNPADTRDWNASPREAGERRGMSDRFVLKFAKP